MNTIFFDLDGTLLPLDFDTFLNNYFGSLTKRLAPLGYNPKELIDAVWSGTKCMVMNDGSKTNEVVFWDEFIRIYGQKALADKPSFDEYYKTDYLKIKELCTPNPAIVELIKELKAAGYRLVVATNPIFPKDAILSRIDWAGLNFNDFEYITSYENSSFAKPNPKYYSEIAEKIGVNPADVLMVGNDATEDLAALKAGMSVFLVTDLLLNTKDVDISAVPHGGVGDLREFIFGK